MPNMSYNFVKTCRKNNFELHMHSKFSVLILAFFVLTWKEISLDWMAHFTTNLISVFSWPRSNIYFAIEEGMSPIQDAFLKFEQKKVGPSYIWFLYLLIVILGFVKYLLLRYIQNLWSMLWKYESDLLLFGL